MHNDEDHVFSPIREKPSKLVYGQDSLLKENHIWNRQNETTGFKTMTPMKDIHEKSAFIQNTPVSIVDRLFELSPFSFSILKKKCSPFRKEQNMSELKRVKRESFEDLPILFNMSSEENVIKTRNEYLKINDEQFRLDNQNAQDCKLDENYENLSFDPLFFQFLNEVDENSSNENKKYDSNILKDDKAKNNEKPGCNCRHSQCLKMYCECFRKGVTCSGCNCSCCENKNGSLKREERLNQLKKRNPNVFKPIVTVIKDKPVHSKGCNCRKSHCSKNYCECHQFGAFCSDQCQCIDCHNRGGKLDSDK